MPAWSADALLGGAVLRHLGEDATDLDALRALAEDALAAAANARARVIGRRAGPPAWPRLGFTLTPQIYAWACVRRRDAGGLGSTGLPTAGVVIGGAKRHDGVRVAVVIVSFTLLIALLLLGPGRA